MNEELAKSILYGLVERAASDRRNTFLSEIELKAIQWLINLQPDQKPESGTDTDDGNSEESIEVSIRWKPDDAEVHDKLVCIDFGTSFSKAYASEGDDPDETPKLIDITLSPDAEGSARYLLPSELLIQKGSLHFGRSARNTFDDVAADQDQLIDNPKQYMTLSKDVSNLEKRMLPETKDPDRLFSERDALVLYLAHLIRMVDLSIAASGLSLNLPMRYTHPAWRKDIGEQNTLAMRRIVAEAMALARCYPHDFETTIELRLATRLLLAAKHAPDENLPFELLLEPVAEATAAGAGALMEAEHTGQNRTHFVILDIGAGTTDVAGCICVRPNEQRAKVWEIQSARDAKNLAGNLIDNALQKFILEKSSLAKGTAEYTQAERALRKTIRNEKEALFSTGHVIVELITHELIEVSLEDFRKETAVESIYRSIKEMVCNAAFSVREINSKVYLVPTGGGAGLSIVEELVSEPLEKDGQKIRLELVSAMPEQLRTDYPQIEAFYPQLAVAIGGAHPALPEQKPSIESFGQVPGRRTTAPTYKSPHS